MKAKEYFKIYSTENQEKNEAWRFIKALRDMVLEVNDIAKNRKAQKDEALKAIFKEQFLKSKSFIRRVNSLGLNYKENAFLIIIQEESPELYSLVFNDR